MTTNNLIKSTNSKNQNIKKYLKMFETKGHIDYILGGRGNPFNTCSHAINGNSISNDWVAVAIQYSEMGKATGICYATSIMTTT